MSENKYFDAFGKPFPVSDVSWKIQRTARDKQRGLRILLYGGSRTRDNIKNKDTF